MQCGRQEQHRHTAGCCPHVSQHTSPTPLPGPWPVLVSSTCPGAQPAQGGSHSGLSPARDAGAQPDSMFVSAGAPCRRTRRLLKLLAEDSTENKEKGSASLNKILLPSPVNSQPPRPHPHSKGPAQTLQPGAGGWLHSCAQEPMWARQALKGSGHSFPTRRPLWRLSDSEGTNGREQHLVIIHTMFQGTFPSCSCFPLLSKLSVCYLGDITVPGKSKHSISTET